MFNTAKVKLLSLALTCAMIVSAFFAQAASAAQEYGALTEGFSAELTAALPIALAAVGLFIGVIMAYKVVRRVLRA